MKNLSIVSNYAKSLAKALIHFVFPSYCIHCKEEKVSSSQLFCVYCRSLIERIFPEDVDVSQVVAVETQGVVHSLLNHSRGPLQNEVMKTMAAWIVLTLLDLPWSKLDVILPLPGSSLNATLAQEVGRLLKVPFKRWISVKGEWKSPGLLSDQIVLVVGMTLTLGESLSILEEASPLKVFQVGFCEEIKTSS